MDLVPEMNYPDLPVSLKREEILDLLDKNQVTLVVGETGSGKTTQLPKMALEWALARKCQKSARQRVGCTQPRRIAASSVARRVAEELKESLGETIGYQVRFEEKVQAQTKIKFMTDGILLAETQRDPDLRQYHTIILDEVHERSLNIDFLLGYLKLLLPRRPDLRVILSSATLDSSGLAEFFADAPILHVEGRTFPVEIEYLPAYSEDEELTDHVARALDWISAYDSKGDVLVFLPGEREIRETAQVLEGRNFAGTEILPLFARLGLADQNKVFHPLANKRRVILATNVAETSLTIPGIIYVIDSGVARLSRYSPQRQIQRLQIEEISQASARQRAGRCGRVCEGVCIRLYDEESMDRKAEFTDPEIRRSSLAAVILRMKSLGLPELGEFPLPNPPAPRLVTEGYRTLREIGAIDRNKELSDFGRTLAKLPVDPRLGRMLIQAREESSLAELLVVVSGLTVMDPRERPADKAQQADEAQRKWADEESDFGSMLKLWASFREFRQNGGWRKNPLRAFCRKNYLNVRRVLEWDNLQNELFRLVTRQFHWKNAQLDENEQNWARGPRLLRAVLAGAPRQFGLWNPETREYRAPGGRSFSIFPGSVLFRKKKRPEWVMGSELVETTKLWMRKCGVLDPAWVEQVAPHLCEIRHSGAAYSPDQGVVHAVEHVVCGGIIIVPKRRVHFGRIDLAGARKIFIQEALIARQMKQKPLLLRRWDEIFHEVELMETKLRMPGQLWCEDAVYEWFDRHIPADCCTDKAFHQWFRGLEAEGKKSWHVAVSEAMYQSPSEFPLEDFPDEISFGNQIMPVDYLFSPGEIDDGATLVVDLDQLALLPDWLPEWGVVGQLKIRVEELLRGLPKDLRVALQPISEAAQSFVDLWRGVEPDGSLAVRLADFVETRIRKACYPEWLDAKRIADWLVMKIAVVDEAGKQIGFGRDLAKLREELMPQMQKRFRQQAGREWEQKNLKDLPEEELPQSVEIGMSVGFPALIDESQGNQFSLAIRVFDSALESEIRHRAGVISLARHRHAQQVAHLRKRLPVSLNTRLGITVFGREPARNTEDFISCSLEAAIGKMPRSRGEFLAREMSIRQDLFDHATRLGKLLDGMIEAENRLKAFISEHKKMRWYDQIARDLEQQLFWMLRPSFLWEAGANRWVDLARYFQAATVRIDRLKQQPVAKDIDKLEQFNELWDVWFATWRKDSQNIKFIDLGYRIDELRVSLFTPNVAVKGKVSVKRLLDEFLAMK